MNKVTYYMYSCDTCCKIREMMKWMVEIVPSVKNPRLEDMDGINESLMSMRQTWNSVFFSKTPKTDI